MSDDELDGMTPRDLIISLRGGIPDTCDWCGMKVGEENIHPEEAGQWVCLKCFESD